MNILTDTEVTSLKSEAIANLIKEAHNAPMAVKLSLIDRASNCGLSVVEMMNLQQQIINA